MSLTLLATADSGRWMFLSLSVLLLAAGPLLFWALGKRRAALEALDGFVLVSLIGLLGLHVVPGAVMVGRGWAILALVAGAVLPTLLERAQRLHHRHTHAAVLALGMLGLGLHTALDGVALAMTGAQTDRAAMALAIVLHRVPVGLAIWWLIYPRHGARAAAGVMLGVAALTIAGFGLGSQWHGALDGGGLALFQAFVAGTLLHVLTHHGPNESSVHDQHPAHHDHAHDHGAGHAHMAACGHEHAHEHDHDHAHDHKRACGDEHHDGHDHAPTACQDGCAHDHGAPSRRWAIPETIGAAIGALCVAVLPLLTGLDHGGDAPSYHDDHYHHAAQHADHAAHAAHDHLSHAAHAATTGAHGHVEVALDAYMERLLHLALETAPALALGFLLAGLLVAFLPRTSTRWLRGRTTLGQAARGMLVGIPIPICSCGVVPLYQSLVRRGAPPAAALAFLIATPELGVEALLLSVPLLGVELTIARLIAACIVALLVGWGLGRMLPAHPVPESDSQDDAPPRLSERLREAARYASVDIVDDTIAWVIFGLAIAAALEPSTLPEILNGMFGAHIPGLDVVLFAIVGLPMYVCASGATPLAAALIFAGASPGAALAFLLAGPASNTTTLGVLSSLHGKRHAMMFAVMVIGLAIGLGLITNGLLGAQPTAPSHPSDHAAFGPLHWLSLSVVTLATLAAVLRNGPRAMLRTIVDLGER